jgi:hypothetical protein
MVCQWFGIKTTRMVSPGFALKSVVRASWFVLKTMVDGFSQFGLKTGGDDFSLFGLKIGGGGFPDLGLKTGIYGLVI